MSARSESDIAFSVRRVLHMCAPVFLVYFLVPEDSWGGISKKMVLLFVLIVVLLVELVRIAFELDMFGLKHHERMRVSAYAWASFAFALAFLLFDPVLVVPVIFGMAWIDPLCGWFRKKRGVYPIVPLIAYGIMMSITLLAISDYSVPKIFLLSVIGSLVAVGAEYPNLRHIDDDFLMVLVPLVVLTLIGHVLI